MGFPTHACCKITTWRKVFLFQFPSVLNVWLYDCMIQFSSFLQQIFTTWKSILYRKGSLLKFHIQKKPYCIAQNDSLINYFCNYNNFNKDYYHSALLSQSRGSEISLCPHAVPSLFLHYLSKIHVATVVHVLQFKVVY